ECRWNFRGERFSTAEYSIETCSGGGKAVVLHQHFQCRGDELKSRHSILVNRAQNIIGILPACGEQNYPPTAHPGPNEFPEGSIKAECRFVQESLMLAHGKLIQHPRHVVHHVPV